MSSLVAVLVLLSTVRATEPSALRRLQTREQILGEQAVNAARLARTQARAAYRLARRGELAFVGQPEARLEDARALDLALLAARRGAGEAQSLREELDRVKAERHALADASRRQPPPDDVDDAGLRIRRPVRGSVVGSPGVRLDPMTGAEVRQDALQILARMNDPVFPPAVGTVRRVERLPQGGYAVVTDHGPGWVSVIAGLREPAVVPGESVGPDVPLGLAGRNLDGAVVISFELWHARQPVDPLALLRHPPRRR
jgi:murein DD-endopeptidase MepM/ murein hydrolase activator NlpD